MAKISIKNMMFYGFHGIYEYEREQGQKFFLDVELITKDNSAAETDKAEDGVDSAIVYGKVRQAFDDNRCTLLQTAATRINKALLASFPNVAQVTTAIRKPSAVIAGPLDYVEVEVTTKQGE